MNAPGRKSPAVLIAVFSLVLVFGALFTALAETGFTANLAARPTQTSISVGEQPATSDSQLTDTPASQPKQQEPSSTPAPQDTADPAASPTSTPSPTSTEDLPEIQPATCTIPDGWNTYTIKSGDTLFSISKLYQTTVSALQSGNCMGTSTRIITGKTLWVPNNATLTPTVTKTPKPTDKPAPTCYLLTLSHTGSGADPATSPANSSGCPAGKYVSGEVINLTAAPASGSTVSGWTGTSNDASTSTGNKVSMPASAKTVSVTYAACYPLTLSHTGSGSDPAPAISSSPGCPVGQYISGTSIGLTASPASGYTVDSWSGTVNNASTSTSNTVSMPAGAHAASVTYVEIPPVCFTLTLSHTGSGADPVASPSSSAGCPSGEYQAGEAITLTANPEPGGSVTGWTGTENDSSILPTNSLTMPASPASVSVTYDP